MHPSAYLQNNFMFYFYFFVEFQTGYYWAHIARRIPLYLLTLKKGGGGHGRAGCKRFFCGK